MKSLGYELGASRLRNGQRRASRDRAQVGAISLHSKAHAAWPSCQATGGTNRIDAAVDRVMQRAERPLRGLGCVILWWPTLNHPYGTAVELVADHGVSASVQMVAGRPPVLDRFIDAIFPARLSASSASSTSFTG